MIAEELGCGPATVDRARAQLPQNEQVEPRLGRDGKTRKLSPPDGDPRGDAASRGCSALPREAATDGDKAKGSDYGGRPTLDGRRERPSNPTTSARVVKDDLGASYGAVGDVEHLGCGFLGNFKRPIGRLIRPPISTVRKLSDLRSDHCPLAFVEAPSFQIEADDVGERIVSIEPRDL